MSRGRSVASACYGFSQPPASAVNRLNWLTFQTTMKNKSLTVHVVEHDFGRFCLNESVGETLSDLKGLAGGDRRQRAVKQACGDLSRFEAALVTLGELAHVYGVHPSECVINPDLA